MAYYSLIVLGLMYGSVLVTEFLAPYDLHSRHTESIFAPPQRPHLFHEGRFVGPFVYPYQYRLDMETLKREYTPDRTRPQPIRFFCVAEEYEFWGLFRSNKHLVCPPRDGTLFLLGTDRLAGTCCPDCSTARASR
jgi:peptide/nickel transport system permease protein